MIEHSERKRIHINVTLTAEEYIVLAKYKRKEHINRDATAIKQLCWKALEAEGIISVET